jgi:hypothetical protein
MSIFLRNKCQSSSLDDKIGVIMTETTTVVSKRSNSLSVLVKVMVLLFALNLLIDRSLQLLPIYTVGDNFDLGNTLAMSLKLPFFWTGLLVPILYLCALWSGSNLLKKYALNLSIDATLLPDLQRLGAYLMYAAMAAILFVPSLEAWINQGARQFKWDWDINAVSVGMIGMLLKFIAQSAQSAQNTQSAKEKTESLVE